MTRVTSNQAQWIIVCGKQGLHREEEGTKEHFEW